ncbi:MAG TPA: nucleoside transporter C-terminal domain-containing protein [Gemmataceae bacterium]|nr:nucleoside transporter C-terminal domain-containing protein [Gemmataceae bacterium]
MKDELNLDPPEKKPIMIIPPMPFSWRLGIGVMVVALGAVAYFFKEPIGSRGRSGLGIICFLGLIAVFSANLRAVNWKTLGWGIILQFSLGVAIIHVEPVRRFFDAIVYVVKQFLAFTNEGSKFVFGKLADPAAVGEAFKAPKEGFVFAFVALPTIIFVASFFTVLYYFGILQFIVRLMAKLMMYLMQTSGAETLSVSANVFMGQTEAPLIIKPYVSRMTQSELLTMMVGGMAHISGALMAVYISMGADPVAILATSVMAAPCSLYLSKLLLPETEEPQTRGEVKMVVERQHANVIDAASAGASDGMRLALNIAAMLIAFLAFIALFDALLGTINEGLSLKVIFSKLFAPVAYLMGVEPQDVPAVADLLGTKLVANEFVAYSKFKDSYIATLSHRDKILVTYALTGFANFASIGIQLGGIGAMAPDRRADLARLGGRALFVGFVATLINASIAGLLLNP